MFEHLFHEKYKEVVNCHESRYSTEVDNGFTKAMCVALSAVATFTVVALFATTMVHAFVLRNLFPNDICIAITERKVKPIMELQESTRGKDIESDGSGASGTES